MFWFIKNQLTAIHFQLDVSLLSWLVGRISFILGVANPQCCCFCTSHSMWPPCLHTVWSTCPYTPGLEQADLLLNTEPLKEQSNWANTAVYQTCNDSCSRCVVLVAAVPLLYVVLLLTPQPAKKPSNAYHLGSVVCMCICLTCYYIPFEFPNDGWIALLFTSVGKQRTCLEIANSIFAIIAFLFMFIRFLSPYTVLNLSCLFWGFIDLLHKELYNHLVLFQSLNHMILSKYNLSIY